LSHASQFLSGRLAEEMVIGALQLVPSVERLTTSAWFGEPSVDLGRDQEDTVDGVVGNTGVGGDRVRSRRCRVVRQRRQKAVRPGSIRRPSMWPSR